MTHSAKKQHSSKNAPRAKHPPEMVHITDEIEIRERYWIIVQKIKSLKVAIDERRNQMLTLRGLDESRPLRSARVRPPKYITALQNMLERDIRTLKEEYNHGKSKNAYTKKDISQIEGLLNELESSFENVLQSMYVPATMVLKTVINKEDTAKAVDDEVVSAHEPDSNLNSSNQEADIDASKELDLVSETRSSQVSQASSLFPNIKQPISSPDVISPTVSTMQLNSVNRDNHVCSAPSASSPHASDSPKPLGITRGYTTLSKPTYSSKGYFKINQHRKPMVGYPFASAFPSLPPLPSKERREAAMMSSLGLGGDVASRPETRDLPPRPIRRMNTFFTKRTMREKTWF